MFAQVIKVFLNPVIAERRKLNENNLSRINLSSSAQVCIEISQYINTYNYSDQQAAAFFIRHSNTIQYILPGEGSKNHRARLDKFMMLLNESYKIIKLMDKEKFSFYRITNDAGEALVKTSHKSCTVIKHYYDGNWAVESFMAPFHKQSGDVVVEISADVFNTEFRKTLKSLNKVAI